MPFGQYIQMSINSGALRESLETQLLIARSYDGIFDCCQLCHGKTEARLHHFSKNKQTTRYDKRLRKPPPEETVCLLTLNFTIFRQK